MSRDNLNNFNDFCTANGSSQGQNLALTVVYVPRFSRPETRKQTGVVELGGMVTERQFDPADLIRRSSQIYYALTNFS